VCTSLHYAVTPLRCSVLQTDRLWNGDVVSCNQTPCALGLFEVGADILRVLPYSINVDDAAVRVQLALEEPIHRTELETALEVCAVVENHWSRLLFVLAADVTVERQFQSGALADQELSAGLGTFIVAVISQSADDAVQSAWWHQHVNRVTWIIPATAVFTARRCASTVYAVRTCPSVCMSQANIVPKWLI